MRVRLFLCALSACLGALPLPSQQEPAQQAPAGTPTPNGEGRLDDQVEQMRRQVQQGRAFHSHVRVTVRLKNGNKVQGIVKDGFVVERIDGMRFVAAEQNDAGAGVRLYTYKGKRNYVFLAFSDIADYRINARMSQQDVLAYERKMKEQDKAQAQRATQDLPAAPLGESEPAAPEQAPSKPGSPDAGATDGERGEPDGELKAMFALLEQYPPSQGWGRQKRDEIARRFVVIGARPSAFEQAFVDRFDEWVRACERLGAKPADEAPATEPAQKGRGRSRRKDRN